MNYVIRKPKSKNKYRDIIIAIEYLEGIPVVQLCKKYNLCAYRIYSIVRAHLAHVLGIKTFFLQSLEYYKKKEYYIKKAQSYKDFLTKITITEQLDES